jgi:HEAT repeat protein
MPLDEALEALAGATDAPGIVDGLYFVAASAPPDQDDRVVAALDRAAGHDDPQVRRAVIVASGYLPWPPMRALLERLQSDPDEAVRRDAGIMLEGKDLYE